MSAMKNNLILTLIFFGLSILFSLISAIISIIFNIDSILLPMFSGILAALTLKAIYLSVNKEIIPRNTKLIITIVYIVVQQLVGIFYVITIKLEGAELASYLGVQLAIQLVYGLLIYLCLSGGKRIVVKMNKK